MNRFSLALAARELRSGTRGFRVFLLCLVLGVAGIAAVGSVAAAISEGLAREGRAILGGDAQLTFSYRGASAEELGWMEANADGVGHVTDLRSMTGKPGGDRTLSQVKGVDGAYPLYGEVGLEPAIPLDEALAPRDGVFGAVIEPILAERLGVEVGDMVTVGGGSFELRALLTDEPDTASGGFALAPRTIVLTEGLREAGLMGQGTLYRSEYRMKLPAGADLDAARAKFEAAFPESGARWRDRRNGSPGVARFVERLGSFLTLVGLAALAVGGVGVATAVSGYLAGKVRSIAALRTFGATAAVVQTAYLAQVGALAAIGIVLGLLIGGGGVALLGPVLAEGLPTPAVFGLYWEPLAVAGIYGAFTAALFAFLPLARLREVRPAHLFRGVAQRWNGGIRLLDVVILVGIATMAAATVIGFASSPKLAAWFLGALAVAFGLLWAVGGLAVIAARRLARGAWLDGAPSLRLALAAVGAAGGQTRGVVLSLGLGLSVLAAIGQVDSNMQRLITEQLPARGPAFFFVDILDTDREDFVETVGAVDGTGEIETAPMLRGVITKLDGVPAKEAQIDPAAAWVLRGDRGVTYAATPPRGTVVTEGAWWPEDYSGEPLVSFAAEEGRELGLEIGSTVTVNILGRDITATVASFREVEWRGMGINFLMVFTPGVMAGAPHTHIATVHAERAAEAEIMRATGRAFPNVTAVRVRDAVEKVSAALGDLGAATRWGAAAALLTGIAVLIGAAAAGAEARRREAAILKVLGATRGRILASFALRSALMGAIAGLVAIGAGIGAGWAVTTQTLEADFAANVPSAVAIVLGGALLSLLAGLGFARGPLRARPAGILREA